jgi:hypothetical protein
MIRVRQSARSERRDHCCHYEVERPDLDALQPGWNLKHIGWETILIAISI